MSHAPPGLGESYSLAELPRIPDLPLPNRVALPESHRDIQTAAPESIDLGISKLIIASYVLKPTPKLAWSYPLSPSTLVDCMDVKDLLYIVGLTERNKNKLLLVHRESDDSVATSEVALLAPASAVKFALSSLVYVLLQTGQVELYQYETESLSLTKGAGISGLATSVSKSFSVTYHAFISSHDLQYKKDLLFYVVALKNMRKIRYHLVALDGARTFEIYETSTESAKGHNIIWTYSSSVLYAFDTVSKQLSSSSIMKPQEPIKTISLANLIGEADTKTIYSVTAVSSDRLLLSFKSLVYLINFKFESVLGDHTNNSGNDVYLAFALPVAGNSAHARASLALYLNFEGKTKTCKLKLILVDVGLNTLSESLGKSLHKQSDTKWNGIPHVNEIDLKKANSDSLVALETVFKTLSKDKAKRNVESFDKHLVEFLKMSDKPKPKFSALTDRVVDQRFLVLILSLVFDLDAEGNVQIIDEAFLPEKGIMYLFTHPLYPAQYAKGLLMLLSQLNQPTLLKQAIDHCSAISIDELTGELTNLIELADEMKLDDHEGSQYILTFLKATVDRLIADYSISQITTKLREVLNIEFETANKKLDRMLAVLISINTNNSWTLVQAVIDVGGLFNWNIPTITRLSEVIDSKLEALTQNSYNLTLANQAVLGTEANKKGKKSAVPKVVDNIHEVTSQRVQLDAILTISNNTKNKLLIDEGIELAKQIPTYSREKLVL